MSLKFKMDTGVYFVMFIYNDFVSHNASFVTSGSKSQIPGVTDFIMICTIHCYIFLL